MKTVAIALFVTCVVGSSWALDCSAKLQDFHKCVEANHKKAQDDRKAKFEALKPKFAACYTDNGCTAPSKDQQGNGVGSGGGKGEHRGNNTAERACGKALRDALKGKFEECVKKTVPDFTFPAKDGQHDKRGGWDNKGFDHKGDNKALEGCANKQAVRDCKRALLSSLRPTEDQKRANFKANCDAKQTCSTALGAECQAQLEKVKTATCQCRQQQRGQADQVRGTIQACQGLPEKQGKHPDGKQQTCDNKDYCKLGYDAFVADRPEHGHGPEGKGKGHQ